MLEYLKRSEFVGALVWFEPVTLLIPSAPGSATWRRMKHREAARLPSGATLYTGRGNVRARARLSASKTTLQVYNIQA